MLPPIGSNALLLLTVPIMVTCVMMPVLHRPSAPTTTAKSLDFPLTNGRVTCDAIESCSFFAFDNVFEMCACPESTKCSKKDDHSAVQRGITYYFCSPRKFNECEVGQLASTVYKVKMSIHCICPDHMFLTKKFEEVEEGKEVRAGFTCELSEFMSIKYLKPSRNWTMLPWILKQEQRSEQKNLRRRRIMRNKSLINSERVFLRMPRKPEVYI